MRDGAAKGKEMGARFAGTQDLVRVFNRALELLNSSSTESDHELLELVKKSKRETEKAEKAEPAPAPPVKKSRRGAAEVADYQALGHRSNLTPLTGDHGSGQSGSGSEGATTQSNSATSANRGQAQARLMNVIRSGAGRGRIEKPKRKMTR